MLWSLVPADVQGASKPAPRPNIIFILADDVGQEVLGCYGGTSYATPRIDALAQTGIRFQHCYSMPSCFPSRLTSLTGRYPYRHGNPGDGEFPVAAEDQTVAHVLKRAGYATAAAGKWQLRMLKNNPDHPRRLGFDESCLFGWHEGPRYYEPHIWQNGKLLEGVKDRYGPDVYCEFLIDFMTRQRKRPFFVYYPMALCHGVTDDLDQPVPFGPRGRYDTYGELVPEMDKYVGRIVDALEKLDLRDKTLIVYTSDNGTPRNYIHTAIDGKLIEKPIVSYKGTQPIHGRKGTLTDGGTRVPLIVSWPGQIKAGEITNALVDLSDFLPTFAELARAPLPHDVQLSGQSFASLLVPGGKLSQRRWVFSEKRGRSFVRSERWKLFRDGPFFDMKADPLESEPLRPEDLSAEGRSAQESLQQAFSVLFEQR